MSKKQILPKTDSAEVPRYTKGQFLKSNKQELPKDLVTALLEDGREYTIEEAEEIISAYLERKVL